MTERFSHLSIKTGAVSAPLLANWPVCGSHMSQLSHPQYRQVTSIL